MSTYGDALLDIQKAIRANTDGLKQVPNRPPEKAADYPFVVTYPESGNQEWSDYNHRVDTHTAVIELHIARKDLPIDVEWALTFIESIPAALKTAEKAGNLGNITGFGALEYTFGPMSWGGVDTLGVRWTLSDIVIHTVAS